MIVFRAVLTPASGEKARDPELDELMRVLGIAAPPWPIICFNLYMPLEAMLGAISRVETSRR